jgi:hypothetical protein
VEGVDPGEYLLQKDYLECYLDLYTGAPEFKKARQGFVKYLDYPILTWRNRFFEIANLLCEYDGEQLLNESESELQTQSKNLKKIKQEEALLCELKDQTIKIKSQNLSQIKILYYLVDLEVLFSRNPFLKDQSEFSDIEPNYVQVEKITQEDQEIQILKELQNKSLFIQVKGQ